MKLMHFIQVLLKFNLKVILWHNNIYAKRYALSKVILIFCEMHGIYIYIYIYLPYSILKFLLSMILPKYNQWLISNLISLLLYRKISVVFKVRFRWFDKHQNLLY